MSEDAGPGGLDARRGILEAAALVAGLIATYLWVSMLVGPWRLASGLSDAAGHLRRAEKALSKTAMKEARYETLAGVAAAQRARAGLSSGGPLMDLAAKLPVAGDALKEVEHLVRAAELSSQAAEGTLDIAQNALRGPDKIIAKDPDDDKGGARIRIDRIEAISKTISDIRAAIRGVGNELRAVELSNIPRGNRRQIRDAIGKAEETDQLLGKAKAGFDLLPSLLGADGPRTYLFGLQNSAEERGPGGALLQFKLMRIEDGKPELLDKTGGTIYEIDRDRRQIDIPLPEDAWYVRNIPDAQRFGNANWSPDWPLSAQLTVAYARASDPSFPDVDGVFALDPVVVKKLMPGVGQFHTKPYRLYVTENRVIQLLLYKAYASYPIPKVRRNHLSAIVDDFYEHMLKPKHPTSLVQGMSDSLAEKHMQLWMKDPAEQAFIERMNWDGAIEDVPKGSDYVFVVEQNVGGNKLDLFGVHTTSMNVQFDGSDAAVSLSTTIENQVFLPQPLYPMGDSGKHVDSNGYHRPMMNVYVPADAQLRLAQVAGTRLDTPAPAVWAGPSTPPEHFERGKKVWSATLEIPPQDKGTLNLGYVSPGVVTDEGGRRVYRLAIQRQPRVRVERFELRIELPVGAAAVKAPGFEKRGNALVWERDLVKDVVLEVSWRS